MRKESHSIEVSAIDWLEESEDPRRPTLTVTFSGDEETARNRVRTVEGEPLQSDEIDVTYRFRDNAEERDGLGVLAITNRLNGAYVLETQVEASLVLEFIRAARRFGDESDDATVYRLSIDCDGTELARYDKRTLLVYGESGELRRGDSLIPDGVEI